MKLVKTASGKKTIRISKSEWLSVGKTAGWMKEAIETREEAAEGAYVEGLVDRLNESIARLFDKAYIAMDIPEDLPIEEEANAIATWIFEDLQDSVPKRYHYALESAIENYVMKKIPVQAIKIL